MLKRFVSAFLAFVGIIVPGTLALLIAPPAHPEPVQPSGCERGLADVNANVAAMQARIKKLGMVAGPETCTAAQLYFLEVVKARAVAALCKSGADRERELGRLDADVEHINGVIAVGCL
ncbi:MAG: hypothetical protein WAK72_01350 [Pseudolabrys sp.]